MRMDPAILLAVAVCSLSVVNLEALSDQRATTTRPGTRRA